MAQSLARKILKKSCLMILILLISRPCRSSCPPVLAGSSCLVPRRVLKTSVCVMAKDVGQSAVCAVRCVLYGSIKDVMFDSRLFQTLDFGRLQVWYSTTIHHVACAIFS